MVCCCVGKKNRPSDDVGEKVHGAVANGDDIQKYDQPESVAHTDVTASIPDSGVQSSSEYHTAESTVTMEHEERKLSRKCSPLRKRLSSFKSKPSLLRASTRHLSQVDLASVEGLTPENQHMFETALEVTVVPPVNWTRGYEKENAEVLYNFTPGSTFAWIHASAHFKDCSVAEAVAGSNVISEWPSWHPTVTKIGHIGPVDKYGHAVHGYNSIALVIKSDFMLRINRFLFNGMVVEVLTPLDPSDPLFVKPKGKRTMIESYVLYVPTSDGVVIIQRIYVDLMYALPAWVVNYSMSHLAPSIIGNFQKLMTRVKDDKRPYKKLMQDDETGVYRSIDNVVADPASAQFRLETWNDLSPIFPAISTYITLPTMNKVGST